MVRHLDSIVSLRSNPEKWGTMLTEIELSLFTYCMSSQLPLATPTDV